VGIPVLKRIYPYLVGIWLACLQTSMFFLLQIYLSSAFLSYGTLLLGWLIGSAIGVALDPRRDRLWLVVSAICPYLLQVLLTFLPHRHEALPLVAALVALCSIYAGLFFQAEKNRFERIGQLFFWETAGFCCGLVASLVAIVMVGGLTLAMWCPGLGLIVLLPFRLGKSAPKEPEQEEST
jgi:hypothetical protein